MNWWLRPVLAFDLETTGTDPHEARIVTWAVAKVRPDGQATSILTGVVNPGVEIPEAAARVHGVTTERAREVGDQPVLALERVTTLLEEAVRARVPLVIYNAAYDLTVLHSELYRHGLEAVLWPKIAAASIIDPLVLDKYADRFRRGSRRLGDTCKVYGVQLDSWHDAGADALAAARLAFKVAQKHQACQLSAADLHAMQITWAADQAHSLQAYFKRQGRDEVVDARWPVRGVAS